MTVADYFIDFFIKNDIRDVFGYQGGMIAYLFDSMGRRNGEIRFHQLSTEQGAALAACGFSQRTGKVAAVLSTSGPGFTNLLTGIANAWYDSIPLICISGQVNTKDKRRSLPIRQLGFQEIQATQVAEPITKCTFEVDVDTDIKQCLEDALHIAQEGRKGPVFIDLPINICRDEISAEVQKIMLKDNVAAAAEDVEECIAALIKAKRPIILAGAGIHQMNIRSEFRALADLLKIPVITTLPAVDMLPTECVYKIGYLGGTARREAGAALAVSDCVLSLGTRLCAKAIGYDFEKFAPNAKLFRVDIDQTEFERKIKPDERQIAADIRDFIVKAIDFLEKNKMESDCSDWVETCSKMKKILEPVDVTPANQFVYDITDALPEESSILLDVGNNLVYGAQSSVIKSETRLMVSGGFGAMGYALPAAVGAVIGKEALTCVICGDGGMQMNIQELNIIGKRRLPIKIFVLNNKSLGHIKLFQKVYLEERYSGTDAEYGDYYTCDFTKIAEAYGISAYKIHSVADVMKNKDVLLGKDPVLFELEYEDCSILPNIHGGADVLHSGPVLKDDIVEALVELGFGR